GPGPSDSSRSFLRFHRIGQIANQERYRHGSDPSRNRGDRRGNGANRGHVDVPLEARAARWWLGDLVNADVHNDSAGANVVRGDRSAPSDRYDENLRLPGYGLEIPGRRMAKRDGGVETRAPFREKNGERAPDDAASPDDHDPFSGQVAAVPPQELEHAERCRRPVAGKSVHPPPYVQRVEPIHVLDRSDVLDVTVLGKVGRERKLQDDAVDAAVRA